MESEWEDNLITNIEEQKCVLILGPELINYGEDGEKTFFGLLSDEMQREKAPYVLKFFHNEELVQFNLNEPGHESRMYGFLKRFYRQRNELDAVFSKLVQLPFPVFISLFPDSRLTDTFKAQQLDFAEAHYPLELSPAEVDLPSVATPLVYNLLGRLDKFDTLLTFDHLFKYLKGVLGSRELPMNLKAALKAAQCFVFVGVKFDKWYMQVLLKLLMDDNPRLRYASSNTLNDEVRTFVSDRLVLQFIDQEPGNFLDWLYERCEKRGWLRGKPVPQKPKIDGRVFISYSYKDDEAVGRLRKRLEEFGLTVITGQDSMVAGEDITTFIKQSVASTDCTISMVSENSLMSPWVARESVTILREKEYYRKLFLPCYLEPSFLDSNIADHILAKIQQTIGGIYEQIQQRSSQKIAIDDLADKLKLYEEHRNNAPTYITRLRNSNVVNLTNANFEVGVAKIIKDIQDFVTKKSNG